MDAVGRTLACPGRAAFIGAMVCGEGPSAREILHSEQALTFIL
jgi:hypothetical protein